MMGRLEREQEQLFYSFRLDEAVPDDHAVRGLAGVLDLSWVHGELAPYYRQDWQALDRSGADDPDADRRLRIRDPLGADAVPRGPGQPGVPLVLRALSIEDKLPDHSAFSRARNRTVP